MKKPNVLFHIQSGFPNADRHAESCFDKVSKTVRSFILKIFNTIRLAVRIFLTTFAPNNQFFRDYGEKDYIYRLRPAVCGCCAGSVELQRRQGLLAEARDVGKISCLARQL